MTLWTARKIGIFFEVYLDYIWRTAIHYSGQHLARFSQMPVLQAIDELQSLLCSLWIEAGMLKDTPEDRKEFLATFWRPELKKRILREYQLDLEYAVALFHTRRLPARRGGRMAYDPLALDV